MELLYLLEDIRVPGVNEFMLLITQLGEETAFLVVALVMFWCVDKRRGYYILTVGFLGTLANQFLKLLFRVPRPWIKDPEFTILEQAREAASGYSFPSGHTQSAVGTFGAIAHTEKNKLIRAICIVVAAAVPFSRMYIGVHTPMDVFVSVGIALALIFVFKKIIIDNFEKAMPYVLAGMVLAGIAYLLYVELAPFPEDVDIHNLLSGKKNAYTLLGAVLGMCIVYIADEKWLNFSVKAVWWAQVCKVALGLGVVLIVKSGLKEPLNFLMGESAGRAARYFLMVVVAGVVWPLSFKWFSKLGNKVR